jgi:hypothetical protein
VNLEIQLSEIRGSNYKKIKVLGQLKSKMKKFKIKNLFLKRSVNLGTQLSEIRVKNKKIKSLKVNQG